MNITKFIPALAMAVGLTAFAPATADAKPSHHRNKHSSYKNYHKNNYRGHSYRSHGYHSNYHSNYYRPYRPKYKTPKRENLSINIGPTGGLNVHYSEYSGRGYGYGYGYPGYRF